MTKTCRGFSLLEVLVAFVILSLSVGVIMRIFSGGLRNAGTADDYTRALYIAESKLAGIGVETPLQEGNESGEVGQRFIWHADVRPFPVAVMGGGKSIPRHNLYHVLVEVRWHDFGADRSVSLTGLRLAPTR